MNLLNRTLVSAICCGSLLPCSLRAQPKVYQPTWESIDSRPVPQWFDDAKFGIFIHWGLYSVPAWGAKKTYAEWYWNRLSRDDSPTRDFHRRTYGETFQYQDFVPRFTTELFEPAEWVDLFARAGARYIVLTTKHHDGFCLWPSKESWNWNSVDVGPHRDLVRELTDAVRARGLKMGFYYSLYEWYHPLYKTDLQRYVAEHLIPQFKDLVERYKPDLIWSDGEWEHPSDVWKSTEFLAWLFNDSSAPKEVVINDRWGKETRSAHGGYYTSELGQVGFGKTLAKGRKWEETRGLGYSFGYNRNESISDYLTARELIHEFIDVISRGGNFLFDVGATADGRIPVIMQERLLQFGDWLKVNGEAIYGAKQWRHSSEGDFVRYTAKEDTLYAICLKWPGRELLLNAPEPMGAVAASLLGYSQSLKVSRTPDGKLKIEVPPLSLDEVPLQYAYVFRLTNVK